MSMHWFTFRQGDRSEYLALYILSALGLAVPVPRQEDVGIDLHCNLARQDGEAITYFAPYNVQVKSSSVKRLRYGGQSKKKKKGKPREWKGYEIEWIMSQLHFPQFRAAGHDGNAVAVGAVRYGGPSVRRPATDSKQPGQTGVKPTSVPRRSKPTSPVKSKPSSGTWCARAQAAHSQIGPSA